MNPEVTDDCRLLRAYAEHRDQTALVEFFSHYQDQLYAFALRVLRNPEDAQDAIQMTFIDVMRRAGEYECIESVRGWLFGIVRKSCALILRSGDRRMQRESIAGREHVSSMSTKDAFRQEAVEIKDAILSVLTRLPERYRDAVMLCYCHGLSEAETAEVLGEKIGTVRVQLSRGLEMIRSKLATGGMALGMLALPDLLSTLREQALPVTLAQNLRKIARNEQTNSISRFIRKHPVRSKATSYGYLALVLAVMGASCGWFLLRETPETAVPVAVAPRSPSTSASEALETYRYTFDQGLPEHFRVVQGNGGWNASAGPFNGVVQMEAKGFIRISQKLDARPTRARMHYCVFVDRKNPNFNCSLHRIGSGKTQNSANWHKKLQVHVEESTKKAPIVVTVTYYWIGRYIFIYAGDELTHVTAFDSEQNSDDLLMQLEQVAVDDLQIDVLREVPEYLRDPEAYIKSMGIQLDPNDS